MAMLIRRLMALSLAALSLSSPALSQPQDGRVVSGQAVIQGGPGGLTIRQGTDKAILEWRSFSIPASQFVRFLQPSQTSAVLNRVTGVNPSLILGELSANGRVFLVNPSGIVFGPTATVNVGSLFATTMQLSNQDFLDGRSTFTPDPSRPDSFVINQGAIQAADGGYVVLMAPLVSNQGSIVARLGTVTLAAVPRTTVNFDGQGLVHYVVPSTPGQDVVLPADLVNDVIGSLVASSTTDASGVELQDGQVRLIGAGGMALNAGRIEASGGQVGLQGDRVGLLGPAAVDVSAPSRAGRVELRGERYAYVGSEAIIRADATEQGDGGEVRVLAGDSAVVDGLVSVRGGPQGGDGGFLETSAGRVSLNRAPDLAAPEGKAGTWLIDPNNIAVSLLGAAGMTDSNPFVSLTDNAAILPSTLENALAMGGTVIVQTGTGAPDLEPGDISVLDPINPLTTTATSKLLLQAHNNIVVAAPIGGQAPLNVELQANWLGSTAGDVVLAANSQTGGGNITTLGGSFTASGSDFIQDPGLLLATSGGNVQLTQTGSVALNGLVDAGPGSVAVQAGGQVSASGVTAQALDVQAGGNAQINSQVSQLSLDTPMDAVLANTGDLTMSVGQTQRPNALTLVNSGAVTSLPSDPVRAGTFVLTATGPVTLNTAVDVLTIDALAQNVDVRQEGGLVLAGIRGSDVAITGTGFLSVMEVMATGSADLSAGGPILGAPLSGPANLTAGNDSTLVAGDVIGTLIEPFVVDVSGSLVTIPGGVESGVSANLVGSVTPSNTLLVPVAPPGEVLFNGVAVLPQPVPPTPVDPVVPPIDPVDPVDPLVPPHPVDPIAPSPHPLSPELQAVDPDLSAAITEAIGAGQQQITHPIPPADPGAPPDPESSEASSTAQATLGFTSTMSNLAPPQPGSSDRFVLAALLQASVSDPGMSLAQLENLSQPMPLSELSAFLVGVLGSSPLSGELSAPVTLESLLQTLFSIYQINAQGNLVGTASALGILPDDVSGSSLNRGQVFAILDSVFFNLRLSDGRTLYQTQFDSEPPAIAVVPFPVVCSESSIALSGSVSPGTTLLRVGYTDADVVVPDDEWRWNAIIPLQPGLNTITVQAYDAAGNITTQTIQVLCTVGS